MGYSFRLAQIRSDCLTFRTSCCSARMLWAQVPAPLSGTGKERRVGRGGTSCTGGYNRVQAVRPGSVAGRLAAGTGRIVHPTAFVTPVVEHWLEQEIAQCVHDERSIR